MEKQEKPGPAELAGLVVIIIILLYFPFQMMSEHSQDAVANSYYHNGR